MAGVVIVGSGPSAVHCALSALERGSQVTMLDVGGQPPEPVLPETTFDDLKDRLDDPVAYFLGEGGQGVVYPDGAASYYGHPPSKQYVFDVPPSFTPALHDMNPVFSFARGGLAGAWTAGSYVWTDADLEDFPFDIAALLPYYQTVATRIGLSGEDDDLSPYLPLSDPHLPALALDPHSAMLLDRYRARRSRLQQAGFFLGRSRVATLSGSHGGRNGCTNLGRCLWGCPSGALYHPAVTLADCQQHTGFRYLPGHYVTHVDIDEGGKVAAAVATELETGRTITIESDQFVLAAGALNSSKIYLETWYRRTGAILRLGGLMDNRQVHVPFLSPSMIGQPVDTASYQFHHLAFGIPRPRRREYVHGQITTLKAAAIQPIVTGMPVSTRMGLTLFKSIRAGLGVANVNMHDERRPESYLTLQPGDSPTGGQLVIHYVPGTNEANIRARAVGDTKAGLRKLGCVIPPGMTRVLPMGTSAHYAGTMPMSTSEQPHTTTPEGRVRGFPNLFVADGATFPFLPAKNLTLTLMANAARIATFL
jgi:choline dehydrogenase-like flavoprotein